MVLDMARESAQGVVQRWGIASAAAVLLLQGCSIDPYQPAPPPPTTWRSTPAPEPSVGDDIAVRAISLLGKPYVWGGADLTGFDCSGLVRFIYDQVGIPVPRTAAEQFSAAKPIDQVLWSQIISLINALFPSPQVIERFAFKIHLSDEFLKSPLGQAHVNMRWAIPVGVGWISSGLDGAKTILAVGISKGFAPVFKIGI